MQCENEKILVSVIVPVYNSEKYLEQCLDSICAQTLKNIEIICVDDGSMDSSPELLQKYSEQDKRVKVLRQQNQYAGIARNNGIEHAQGEYLVFWDSDDFFMPEALEVLYERARQMDADICVCGANQYFESKGKSYPYNGYMNKNRIPETDCFNRETNPDYILNFTNEAVWNKIYKRTFVEENHLTFPGFRVGEDVFFAIVSLCVAEKITTTPKVLLEHRRNNPQSLVGTSSLKPLDPFMAWVEVAAFLDEKNRMPEKSFVNKVTGTLQILLRRLQSGEAFDAAVNYLREDNHLATLHIKAREEEYYYHPEYARFTEHLLNDGLQQFREYLTYSTYLELTEKVAEIRGLKKENGKYKKKNVELEKKSDDALLTLKQTQKELEETRKKLAKTQNKLQTASDKLEKSRQGCIQMKNELDVRRKEADKIRNSTSYRLGRALLWLPIKIRGLFKKGNC